MMNIVQPKTFNLNDNRPKVLLVGNGLMYHSSVPWHKLIKLVSREGMDISPYEKLNPDGTHNRFFVPNTVLTLATSVIDDKSRHNKYVSALSQENYPENNNICRLMRVHFDAVLTTNYSYELEAAQNSRYPRLSPESKRKYAVTTAKEKEAKYLLQTFNRIRSDGPDIWHIHGELRRPSSIILSHDEYARYISCIMQFNKKRGNDYEKHINDLRFISWVDYFLQGDVFILGLGMDYAEFDLWWLLGRRLREKAGCGTICFYEPIKKENIVKQRALQDCGVTVCNCNINLDNGDTYGDFYDAAIGDIESKVR